MSDLRFYFVNIKVMMETAPLRDPETLLTMPSLREKLKLVTRALTVAGGLPLVATKLWTSMGYQRLIGHSATGAVPVTAPVTRRVSRDMREVQRERNSSWGTCGHMQVGTYALNS